MRPTYTLTVNGTTYDVAALGVSLDTLELAANGDDVLTLRRRRRPGAAGFFAHEDDIVLRRTDAEGERIIFTGQVVAPEMTESLNGCPEVIRVKGPMYEAEQWNFCRDKQAGAFRPGRSATETEIHEHVVLFANPHATGTGNDRYMLDVAAQVAEISNYMLLCAPGTWELDSTHYGPPLHLKYAGFQSITVAEALKHTGSKVPDATLAFDYSYATPLLKAGRAPYAPEVSFAVGRSPVTGVKWRVRPDLARVGFSLSFDYASTYSVPCNDLYLEVEHSKLDNMALSFVRSLILEADGTLLTSLPNARGVMSIGAVASEGLDQYLWSATGDLGNKGGGWAKALNALITTTPAEASIGIWLGGRWSRLPQVGSRIALGGLDSPPSGLLARGVAVDFATERATVTCGQSAEWRHDDLLNLTAALTSSMWTGG